MIKPSNITQTHETDPVSGSIQSRTELLLQSHHIHHCDFDAESIAYFDNDAKRQIWHHIYGELFHDIERLRCKVLQFAPDDIRTSLSEDFDKLIAKVRNPFFGV